MGAGRAAEGSEERLSRTKVSYWRGSALYDASGPLRILHLAFFRRAKRRGDELRAA